MDTPPPSAVGSRVLTRAVRRGWSIEPDSFSYVPKGVGSYHWRLGCRSRGTYFVTVDDLDTKPWIGTNRSSVFAGLAHAYETAWTLHHKDGLALVVAPIRSDDGSVLQRIDEQYSVAVFPFVEGEAGDWGAPIARDARERLLHELAGLHNATRARQTGIARRPHGLPERGALVDALASLNRPWTGGRYSEPARRALSANAPRVLERLTRFDELTAELRQSGLETVVTHGEPHPGNLMRSPSGLRLIDWDTVALAEPERDLWMLEDGSDGLDVYTESTGHTISQVAIDFYRLAWTLSDIASFTHMFRSEHTESRWHEQKWNGFVALLEGAPSTPYGPPS